MVLQLQLHPWIESLPYLKLHVPNQAAAKHT